MATYSEPDICNIALGRIGVDRTIASLNEASKEARNCKRFYPLARDEVLEKHPWAFALRVKPLALLPTAPGLLPGFAYAYALPADAASVLEVVPAGMVDAAVGYYGAHDCCGPWNPGRGYRYAFRRALSDDGTTPVLLSNLADAWAVYNARVENTAAYSTLFVSLVADRLAMELAMPMTVDPRWFQVCQQRYDRATIEAATRDLEQQAFGPEADPPAIRARG